MTFSFKTATTFALATGALLLPIAAQAEPTTFERDGTTYAYTTKLVNGRTVITGKAEGGKAFRLVVSETRVRGDYNGTAVDFPLRDVKTSVEAVAMR